MTNLHEKGDRWEKEKNIYIRSIKKYIPVITSGHSQNPKKKTSSNNSYWRVYQVYVSIDDKIHNSDIHYKKSNTKKVPNVLGTPRANE